MRIKLVCSNALVTPMRRTNRDFGADERRGRGKEDRSHKPWTMRSISGRGLPTLSSRQTCRKVARVGGET